MTPQTSTRRKGTVLAVTSGKGGVGKTNLAINVSVALARLGHRVAVVDADFALGNIDVMLGLTPNAHVGHILSGEKSLGDVLMEGPRGLSIVPAGSGLQALSALTEPQIRNRSGELVPNPLFQGADPKQVRDKSLVLFAGLVGVPWQDAATDASLAGPGLEYLPAAELHRQGRVSLFLGDPANPDPTKVVHWGQQTFDEMMIGYIEYFTPNNGDVAAR